MSQIVSEPLMEAASVNNPDLMTDKTRKKRVKEKKT